MNTEDKKIVDEMLSVREEQAVANDGKTSIFVHLIAWGSAILYAANTSIHYGSYSKILISFALAAVVSICVVATNNTRQAQKREEIKKERQIRKDFIDEVIKNENSRNGFSVSKEVRDGEENYAIAVDQDQKKWILVLADQQASYFYNFSELIDFEVHQDGDTIISGNTGDALLGGLVFGTVGAIVGSAGAKDAVQNCTDLHVDILFNDVAHLRQELPFITHAVTKQSLEYKYAVVSVKEVVAVLTFIKANTNENNATSSETQNAISKDENNKNQHSDGYAELERLYEMKNKGIITDDEYDQKKKQILSL